MRLQCHALFNFPYFSINEIYLSSLGLILLVDFVNLAIGVFLVLMGVVIIFVGNYYSKIIGILHVLIYFMASFVILGGVIFIFFYDRPSLV